jgi:hypothetical protein
VNNKRLFILTFLATLFIPVRGLFAQTPPESVGWKGANNVAAEWMWGIDDGSGHGRDYAATERDITDAVSAGIRWNRFVVYAPPNTRTSYEMDRLISLQRKHGIHILMNIQKLDGHYDRENSSVRKAYKAWLKGMVRRYKGDVHYYEIHNEENGNGPDFWMDYGPPVSNPDGTGEPVAVEGWPGRGDCSQPPVILPAYIAGVKSYVAFLQDSYVAIKAADPTAKVILGGLSEWGMECFVDRLKVERAYQWMDYMALHPYWENPLTDQVNTTVARLQAMQKRIATWPAPYNKMGIWITEIGFHAEPDYKSPGRVPDAATKAEYLARTMNDLRANGITAPIFWYLLHQDGHCSPIGSCPPGSPVSDNNQVGYGLTVRDAARPEYVGYEPAYFSYQSMADPSLDTVPARAPHRGHGTRRRPIQDR